MNYSLPKCSVLRKIPQVFWIFFCNKNLKEIANSNLKDEFLYFVSSAKSDKVRNKLNYKHQVSQVYHYLITVHMHEFIQDQLTQLNRNSTLNLTETFIYIPSHSLWWGLCTTLHQNPLGCVKISIISLSVFIYTIRTPN